MSSPDEGDQSMGYPGAVVIVPTEVNGEMPLLPQEPHDDYNDQKDRSTRILARS